ncbi:MAG TPA: helix-turn-helix domain-containing protein [Polyangiaceae bacterium]|nr:helix-turn-helix domain-containing protein [Polyangiaceae bacterium]
MGIDERRAREREQRRADILAAAFRVAERAGWAGFSVEQVAAEAELGRATIYGYFESFEALVLAMAEGALERLSARVAAAPELMEALDVPLRYSQAEPAAFALLFPPAPDPRAAFSNPAVEDARAEARRILGRLQRLAAGFGLPEDAKSAAAFIAGISMAGAVVPELRGNTPLRRRWQDFCLKTGPGGTGTPPETGE